MTEVLALLMLLAVPKAHAQDASAPDPLHLQGEDAFDFRTLLQEDLTQWTVRMGWGYQHNLPTGPRTGMFGDTWCLAYNRFRSPRVALGFQANAAHIHAQEKRVREVSGQILYTRVFSLEPRRIAYWDVGFGLMHFDERVRELATHTNFVEHIGCGVSWPAGDRNAISLEYRFVHVSNGGRKRPNIGLNSSLFSIGYSWFR
jgi:hypothetical protein